MRDGDDDCVSEGGEAGIDGMTLGAGIIRVDVGCAVGVDIDDCTVGAGDGWLVSAGDGWFVSAGDGCTVGVDIGCIVGVDGGCVVRVNVGCTVGADVGCTVGMTDGVDVAVGATDDGRKVGTRVGLGVALNDGRAVNVGRAEGRAVGRMLGIGKVGLMVGDDVGWAVGSSVGTVNSVISDECVRDSVMSCRVQQLESSTVSVDMHVHVYVPAQRVGLTFCDGVPSVNAMQLPLRSSSFISVEGGNVEAGTAAALPIVK